MVAGGLHQVRNPSFLHDLEASEVPERALNEAPARLPIPARAELQLSRANEGEGKGKVAGRAGLEPATT